MLTLSEYRNKIRLQKDNSRPIRIKDIAKQAGVSTGTVDRVIHGRGKVSEENERKIKEAIKQLDYKPNMMARSLARKRDFNIAVFMPNISKDSFWKSQMRGITKAYQDLKDFGLQITTVEFNDQVQGDLLKFSNILTDKEIDAIILAPTTDSDSHLLLDKCNSLKIPYILVNTNLNRVDEQCIGYVGQDSFESGMLGAKLLWTTTNENSTLALFHMENELERSKHMLQKEKGFLSFFEQRKTNIRNIATAGIPALQEKSELINSVQNFLSENPKTEGIFVTTSRIHYLVEVLNILERSDISIVGFDLIEENIKALSDYEKLYLINQNPERQAYAGLSSLFDFLLEKKTISQERYLPLDVVTYENVSGYVQVNKDMNPL